MKINKTNNEIIIQNNHEKYSLLIFTKKKIIFLCNKKS